MFGRRKEIVELALARRLPSMHFVLRRGQGWWPDDLGPELKESYQRAAVLAK
jgi:hypothetical protein